LTSSATVRPTPSTRRAGRLPLACVATSVALLALVGALGDSAATPGLGPPGGPPWDLALHPGALPTAVLSAAGYLMGALGVLTGLRALRAGWRPAGRTVALSCAAALALLVLVPPVGSADHLSYVAYGRIAAAGGDPYAIPPIDWRGGTDPVAGAVQPPWQHTPSVYGPVATAVQALVALAGGGSLRLTVWLWQLICASAFAVVALVLHRLAGPDSGRGARVAVVWTLNPLLLGELVLGAHVDVLAVALAVGVPALAVRRPAAAGILLGAAVGTKAPYALFGLAGLWTLRHLPRRDVVRCLALGTTGALVVLVPAHLWAGPHVFDQLGTASGFTSLATPWRAVANLGDLVLGSGALRGWLVPVALLCAGLLAVPLWRRRIAWLPSAVDSSSSPAAADAVRAALVLTAAWALIAPYALPWYDAMVWAPLALVGPSWLDGALLVRLAVLALAYVPGRVVELTSTVERITLAGRTFVAPVIVAGVILLVARWAWTGSGEPPSGDEPPVG
jgi:hypothetical protein